MRTTGCRDCTTRAKVHVDPALDTRETCKLGYSKICSTDLRLRTKHENKVYYVGLLGNVSDHNKFAITSSQLTTVGKVSDYNQSINPRHPDSNA